MEIFGGILFLIILIFSVVFHEVAHGFVADKLGDPTARLSGRLTLNPLPHLDPIGSIIVPLFLLLTNAGILFGWARPVPFDPFNLKSPRRDSALISLAGPGTNLVIALLLSILLRLFITLGLENILTTISPIIVPIITLNLILGIFNLIPIHPLDGFKIVGGLLSEEQARNWYELERYGIIFFLALLFFPVGNTTMLNLLLGPVLRSILGLLIPQGLSGGII